jgi:hypothetical protein
MSAAAQERARILEEEITAIGWNIISVDELIATSRDVVKLDHWHERRRELEAQRRELGRQLTCLMLGRA